MKHDPATRLDADLILVGGGLANGLIALRLKQLRPEVRVLVLESGSRFGGNHTWSFHGSDLTKSQRDWTSPLVAHRWPFYQVSFPGLHRRIDLPYCSATSGRLHDTLVAAGVPARFDCDVATVEPRAVCLADGTKLAAGAVVDGRGALSMQGLNLGWQKFVGLEVQLRSPHRLTGPILMDATVEQRDGYRFLYVLPFGPDRLLIEDTAYSDDPALDHPALRAGAEVYALSKGWIIEAVEREESGVLPITLGGDHDTFWASRQMQPCSGLRAGLFHPTTGYSWPEAVKLADVIATMPDLTAEVLAAAIQTHAKARWRSQRFYRLLNRMLFRAGSPANRWTVMRRFYRIPEPAIARFYAGSLQLNDKLRLLVGKPPVPVMAACRAAVDWGAPSRV